MFDQARKTASSPLAAAMALPTRQPSTYDRRSLLRRVFDLLCTWQRRHETRCRLAELDDRALRDVGLTRAQVQVEASKPFWMV